MAEKKKQDSTKIDAPLKKVIILKAIKLEGKMYIPSKKNPPAVLELRLPQHAFDNGYAKEAGK